MRRRGLCIHVAVEIWTGSSVAAADREGRMEVPLALLVNQPPPYTLKNASLFFTNPAWLTSFYITPKYIYIYIFSYSLNSHSGYTQLIRHY